MMRGDIYIADLSPVKGSEQDGIRPVLVIQNDIGNKFSPTVIVAVITSKLNKSKLPTHVEVNLYKPSLILLEQIKTLDKLRLKEYVCTLSPAEMDEVDKALKISLELKK